MDMKILKKIYNIAMINIPLYWAAIAIIAFVTIF